MEKPTTTPTSSSSVEYEVLERWAREQVRLKIQDILEEEVNEFLGRAKWERANRVDAIGGYRNGYGKPRSLTMTNGTIDIRRPRVRGLEERFVSKVLPLFARRTREVGDLLPQLYLHGLAGGDFELALRGLLGEKAPLSAGTVARLKGKWQNEYKAWSKRSLRDLEVAYMWADGIYVKAGLEKEKAVVLTVIGGLSDGSKVILYMGSGYRESKESWLEALRDMKARGLEQVRLAVADGGLGLWAALPQVYPECREQRCWNHKIVNVLDQLPVQRREEANTILTGIPYEGTQKEAEARKGEFGAWCRKNGYQKAAEILENDWERMITFYSFPKEHWHHIRTSNIVESPFASLRLRTDAAKRYKKVENATAVIWKLLLVAESRFRKLNAPTLLKVVYQGVEFKDGVAISAKTKGEKGFGEHAA